MDSITTVVRAEDGARIQFRRLMLVVTEGPDQGREVELQGGDLTVGRGEAAGLRLNDSAVSREHFRLSVDTEGVRVEDLGSRSGTRVNGVSVGSARLSPGAVIQIGATSLRLSRVETELSAPRHGLDEFMGMMGGCLPMRELFGLVERVAPLSLPVLLRGETGTGKEGLARAIHQKSPRAGKAFVVVDCTLLGDPTHARSELFGHEKGSFTGAEKPRTGAFALADGGTLFLDEIGELPAEIQAQLLRVLQEGEVKALGSERVTRVDVRMVSATHRPLEHLVAEGRFRRDLFFRLAGITLEVPPLRARERDVELLARYFLPEGLEFEKAAVEALRAHDWPGNVRELQFVIERAAALARGNRVTARDLGLDSAVSTPITQGASPSTAHVVPPSVRDRAAKLDAQVLIDALQKTGGNRKDAAKLLGVSRATLYRKLAEFGLEGGG